MLAGSILIRVVRARDQKRPIVPPRSSPPLSFRLSRPPPFAVRRRSAQKLQCGHCYAVEDPAESHRPYCRLLRSFRGEFIDASTISSSLRGPRLALINARYFEMRDECEPLSRSRLHLRKSRRWVGSIKSRRLSRSSPRPLFFADTSVPRYNPFIGIGRNNTQKRRERERASGNGGEMETA